MKFLVMIAAAASVSAQSTPWVGQMIDLRGFLRPVTGISGAFIVDAPVARGVLSAACSQTLCLVKTDQGIYGTATVMERPPDAPPGPALIALDGDGAVLFFPQTRQFARWRDGALQMVDLAVDGEVLAIRADLTLAVRRGDGVWIISPDGAILDSLPRETGPVLLIDGGIVYATPESLVLRRADANEVRFPAPNIDALSALGDGYVEAWAGTTLYALRTAPGHEGLYLLPQPPPPGRPRR